MGRVKMATIPLPPPPPPPKKKKKSTFQWLGLRFQDVEPEFGASGLYKA